VPPKERARAYHERLPLAPREDAARRGEQDSVPSSEKWPASAPREYLYLMSQDEQLGFPLQVTAPQWSQRAEQAANDEVHEREQQSGASSAGTKSAMLAEKLLLTAGVGISAPFSLPHTCYTALAAQVPQLNAGMRRVPHKRTPDSTHCSGRTPVRAGLASESGSRSWSGSMAGAAPVARRTTNANTHFGDPRRAASCSIRCRGQELVVAWANLTANRQ